MHENRPVPCKRQLGQAGFARRVLSLPVMQMSEPRDLPPPLLLLTSMFVATAGPQRGSQCHLCCHTAARGPCSFWAGPLGPSQNRCHATKAPHSSQPAGACAAKSATGQRQAEPVFVQAGEAAGLGRCGLGRPCSATGCTDEVRSTHMRTAPSIAVL